MQVAGRFPGPVFVRAAKQEYHVHAPRRSRHSHLVEATATATRRRHSACSVFFPRNSAWSADRMVGSASRRSNRAGMDSEWDAASDAGRTGRLFLFCQTRLAREFCFHLSAMATGKRPFVFRNSAWRAGASLGFAPTNWKRTVGGGGCFHRNPGPNPRVYELLRVSIFLRRRSLAILGEPLSDRSGGHDRRQTALYKSNHALGYSEHSDLPARITDLAAMSNLSKC